MTAKFSLHKIKFFNEKYIFLSLPLFTLLFTNYGFAESSSNSYKLGVFPHLSESHIEKAYTAIAKDLSSLTTKPVNFDADDNFENFSSNLKGQVYDIVLVQPFDYIQIAKDYGYQPLASQEKPLRAVIVVRQNSPLRTLQNLLGRDLYLPPRSTAISYLVKHHLANEGFNLQKDLDITHESTHISCLLKVIIRIADACATAPEAVKLFESKMHVQFRVLNTTNPIPHALFATHPRVAESDKSAIKKRLISWEMTNSGTELLKLSRMTGLRSINDKEYNVVRQIKKEVDQYPAH